MAGSRPAAKKIAGPWPGILLVAALLLTGGEGMANEPGDWISGRQAEHAKWQAAHHHGDAAIATIKARTQAAIAGHDAATAQQREAREAKWLAQSNALDEGQRADLKVKVDRASALLQDGKCDEAAPLFREVLAADHINHPARFGLGRCLQAQGKLAQAAAELTEVITLPLADPQHRMTKTMAMLFMQQLPPPTDPRISDPSVVFAAQDKPAEVWDAPFAPVMTVVPAGEFTMGSPEGEVFRLPNEKQHRVRVGYPLAFSKYNVTRGEFAAFVADTGYEAKGCNREGGEGMGYDPDGDWRTPGFDQEDDHPVTCMNFYDATAYAEWLSEKTGQRYRLPSEAEWEHAMRGGTSTTYYWGDVWEPGRANVDGQPGQPGGRMTTPGGTFPANPFGLYDMAGNVWVWLADCYNANYDGAPVYGSAWMSGNCAMRVRRSGSWFNIEKTIEGDYRQPGRLRSASRFGSIPSLRYSSFGFRVVREL